MIEKLAQFTDIRCCLIIGGLSDKVRHNFVCFIFVDDCKFDMFPGGACYVFFFTVHLHW